jgi:hypothetical protein
MIVIEAINRTDSLKPNGYSQDEKIRWLSMLDGIVKKEIIDTHEGGEKVTFEGYDGFSLMQELLVPAPYDDIYIKWLEAQIDYTNGEYGKYNNSITMYNNAYLTYAKAYHREHRPINTAKFTNF